MKHATFLVAVHVFFIKDKKILLARRFQTGYEDGNYSVPAGHLEAGESPLQAACREVAEEIGLTMKPTQLKPVLVLSRLAHRQSIDFFFVCQKWGGEPCNTEPNKCDDLRWVSLDRLPANTVPYIKKALNLVAQKEWYGELEK